MTRRIALTDRAGRTEGWTRKYSDLIGNEMMGKTIGLVGLGRIGAATAHWLKAFGVKLVY